MSRKPCNVKRTCDGNDKVLTLNIGSFIFFLGITGVCVIFAIFNWQVFAALAVIFGFMAFLVLFGIINLKGMRTLACKIGCGEKKKEPVEPRKEG